MPPRSVFRDAALAASKTYTVEKIIDHRIDDTGAVRYLVRWAGYSKAEDTWEPSEHILDRTLLSDYTSDPVHGLDPAAIEDDVAGDEAEGEDDLEVDRIISSRTVRGGGMQYLVKWADDDETWEDAAKFPVDEWTQVAEFWARKGEQPPADAGGKKQADAARRAHVEELVAVRTVKGGGLEYLVRRRQDGGAAETWEAAYEWPLAWEEVSGFWSRRGEAPPAAASSSKPAAAAASMPPSAAASSKKGAAASSKKKSAKKPAAESAAKPAAKATQQPTTASSPAASSSAAASSELSQSAAAERAAAEKAAAEQGRLEAAARAAAEKAASDEAAAKQARAKAAPAQPPAPRPPRRPPPPPKAAPSAAWVSQLPAQWSLGAILGATASGKSRAIGQLRAAGLVSPPAQESAAAWPDGKAIISAIAASPLVVQTARAESDAQAAAQADAAPPTLLSMWGASPAAAKSAAAITSTPAPAASSAPAAAAAAAASTPVAAASSSASATSEQQAKEGTDAKAFATRCAELAMGRLGSVGLNSLPVS